MTILGSEIREGAPVLTLDTSMTPRAFAQSGLPKLLGEAGFIVGPDGSVTETLPRGTFSVAEDEKEHMSVFFGAFEGVTLLQLARGENSWKRLHAALCAIERLDRAGGHGSLPLEALCRSGPESAIVGADGTILVLPPTLFRRCLASAGDAADTENRQKWVHPESDAVTPERAFAFLAGTLAYCSLSGKAAFEVPAPIPGFRKTERPQTETLAREMHTARFEPMALAAPALRPEVANAIDALINVRSETGFDSFRGLGYDRESLFNGDVQGKEKDPALLRAREAFARKLDSIRKREAFLRKNRGLLAGIAVGAAVIGAVGITMANDLAHRPSTKGLAAEEVVSRFYWGISTLDQEWPDACLARGVKTDYSNFLSSLYVTAKVRESYERNGGIVSPALLFTLGTSSGRTVYGVTGLEYAANAKTQDDEGSDSVTYESSFWIWLPSSESSQNSGNDALNAAADPGEQISIYRYRDRLTVSFVKDAWRISAFEPLERQLIMGDGNEIVRKIADGSALFEPWAPTSEQIAEAAQGAVGN